MKKALACLICGAIAASVVGVGRENSAQAVMPFFVAWKAKYVKGADTPLAKAVDGAKCTVCHKAGTDDKKMRNAYGMELAKLIKKTDAKDMEKIEKAFAEVGKMKPKKDGPTYAELIESGKLPGAE